MSSSSSRSGSWRQTSRICAPPLHLRAADLARLLELALGDQLLELAAADHVGALADDAPGGCRRRSRGSRCPRRASRADAPRRARLACPRRLRRARGCASGVVPQQPPTRLTQPCSKKRPSTRGDHLGRLEVAGRSRRAGPAFGTHATRSARDRRERAQVIGHELGAGRAVEADGEQVACSSEA